MHSFINCHTGAYRFLVLLKVYLKIIISFRSGTEEEYDEKIQLLTDVSELEKEEQTKKEVKIEKKKTEEEKAKEIRKRALENLNRRKDENVVGM